MRMIEALRGEELCALVRRVFAPRPGESRLAILLDLPDAVVADTPDWATRRGIAAGWLTAFRAHAADLGLAPSLVLYRNAHTNNGDLPDRCWIHGGGPLPDRAEDLDPAASVPFAEVLARHPILLAPTQFSATAPLKVAAKVHGFRAATMGGFCEGMIPALRLDYAEVNRRVGILADLLDRAEGADIAFAHPAGESRLHLDLRFRHAHRSGGLLHETGAGNLPSGEAYIVPYEGETEPSRSAGELPVQLDGEVVRYRIVANRAVAVVSEGPVSAAEAAKLAAEPAYGNLAELGLGVLDAFGVKPIGKVLLDEKLGLHIAFGRSEHFGGQVGPRDFSSADAVIHIDRIYTADVQPDVKVASADLALFDGTRVPLMRDGVYAVNFA